MIEGLKPYSAYRKSPLPWVAATPEHWRSERGKALFSESLLPVRNDDEIVTCFRDGQVTLRKNRRTRGFMLALHELGYQGVRQGQLVIHAMDAFAGAIGISDSDGKCTPEYIVCNPRSEDLTPAYFSLVLRLAAQQGFILASCPAVRERAPRFRYPHFGAMLLPVPPADEQAAIVRFLDHANRRIERYIRGKRKLIALLNEQKQAIIHRAVTRGNDPTVPMKDSGVPWLGEIPAHWEVRRLKSLVVASVAGPYGSSLTKAMYTPRGYRVYGQQQVIADDFSVGDYYIPKELFARLRRHEVFPGDVLVSVMGTVGRVAVVPESAETGIINPRLVRYQPDLTAVRPRYLQLVMQSASSRRQLQEASKGTTMDGLNMRILGQLVLSIAPKGEQELILDYLAHVCRPCDRSVESLEREIALMREYRTRLVADVVAGQLDVREAARTLPKVELDATALESDVDDSELLGDDADLTDGEAA